MRRQSNTAVDQQRLDTIREGRLVPAERVDLLERLQPRRIRLRIRSARVLDELEHLEQLRDAGCDRRHGVLVQAPLPRRRQPLRVDQHSTELGALRHDVEPLEVLEASERKRLEDRGLRLTALLGGIGVALSLVLDPAREIVVVVAVRTEELAKARRIEKLAEGDREVVVEPPAERDPSRAREARQGRWCRSVFSIVASSADVIGGRASRINRSRYAAMPCARSVSVSAGVNEVVTVFEGAARVSPRLRRAR